PSVVRSHGLRNARGDRRRELLWRVVRLLFELRRRQPRPSLIRIPDAPLQRSHHLGRKIRVGLGAVDFKPRPPPVFALASRREQVLNKRPERAAELLGRELARQRRQPPLL